MSDDTRFGPAEHKSSDDIGDSRCASCDRTLRDTYFVANGAMICSDCRMQLLSTPPSGSALGRFVKAIGFGSIGGAVGAGIYFGILKMTGYEVGLVAIVVGFLVGAGVRLGTGGRGGLIYQALAVGITYCSIVATYVPLIVEQIDASITQETLALTTDVEVPKVTIRQDHSVSLNGSEVSPAELKAELATTSEATSAVWYHRERMDSDAPPPIADEVATAIEDLGLERLNFNDPAFTEPMSVMDSMTGADLPTRLYFAGFLMFFAATSPFLGLPENLIGLAIIGFALYQAWSMNKREKLQIEGPLELGGATPTG